MLSDCTKHCLRQSFLYFQDTGHYFPCIFNILFTPIIRSCYIKSRLFGSFLYLFVPKHFCVTNLALRIQIANKILLTCSLSYLFRRGRWKRKYWKTQVGLRICRDGKRKYGKCKYNANLQSDKKSLVLHELVCCIFKWGGKVDYRLFFEIT